MISHLKGILEYVGKDHIVVDVNNVGYHIKVSSGTLAKLPKTGEKFQVYTYQVVREDDISLYGFVSKEEKGLFALLLSVSGIGPKASLALLSSFPIEKLTGAITSGNVSLISSVPGIGKKTAQKMVIELKEKVAKAYALKAADTGVGVPDAVESPLVSDAISALVSLGYSSREARAAVAKVDAASDDVEAIIKQALKSLV